MSIFPRERVVQHLVFHVFLPWHFFSKAFCWNPELFFSHISTRWTDHGNLTAWCALHDSLLLSESTRAVLPRSLRVGEWNFSMNHRRVKYSWVVHSSNLRMEKSQELSIKRFKMSCSYFDHIFTENLYHVIDPSSKFVKVKQAFVFGFLERYRFLLILLLKEEGFD